MKTVRVMIVALGFFLLAMQLDAEDLAKYRGFKLGMSLAQVSRTIGTTPEEVVVVLERPTLLQNLSWRPPQPLMSEPQTEAVQRLTFSFFDQRLYQIVITYDQDRTEGLTVADLRQALSLGFGPPDPAMDTKEDRRDDGEAVVRWQNQDFRVELFRSNWNDYQLVLVSKTVELQARVASALALSMEKMMAGSKEAARLKKDAADLAAAREKNKKLFRP